MNHKGFVKYIPIVDRTHAGVQSVVGISIQKCGKLEVSSACSERYGLPNCTHVVFYFNQTEKQIGLSLINDSAREGAFKLSGYSKRPQAKNRSISGKSFLKHHGLTLEKSRRYTDVWWEHDMLIVQLEKDGE